MKKLSLLILVGTFAIVIPSQARAWNPSPFKVDGGANVWFNVHKGGFQFQLGPWYTYWPMEAHFQKPAPVGGHWPHWPAQWPPAQKQQQAAPQKSPTPNTVANPRVSGATAPYRQPLQLTPAAYRPMPGYSNYSYGYRPAGYYYPSPPSYWYGR